MKNSNTPSTSTDIGRTVSFLCDRVQSLLDQHISAPRERILIALAGVPGSGKSTISSRLITALRCRGIMAVVLPVDGFHYCKADLAAFNDAELAFRKRGAPFTFDVNSLLELVSSLKKTPVATGAESEAFIQAPSFDHSRQDPVEDDVQISSKTQVVVIEGNYTLLNEDPWDQIAEAVDERWFVDVPPHVAKQRLIKRHIEAGIEPSIEMAEARVEDNDLPNGNLIRSKLITPDITVVN